MNFGLHSSRYVKSKLNFAQLINLRHMVKLNEQIEPSRTCFNCMLVRDNNLGTSGYIFVNLRITKDCMQVLIVVQSLLYVDKIVRL